MKNVCLVIAYCSTYVQRNIIVILMFVIMYEHN